MDYMNKKSLRMVYGDVTLGLHGTDFHYLFSYQTGGLESMNIKGKEWIYRAPRPTFWRATTDNDRGNQLHLRSGMWLGADMFIKCTGIEVCVEDEKIPLPIAPENNRYTGEERAEKIKIIFQYETITVPATKVEVAYEVFASGTIKVQVHYFGQRGLPELPVFGMRFVLPWKIAGYQYQGLSGETYPDRMAGGIPGIHEIEGMPVTPYLVPQDCNVHMDTKWLDIFEKDRSKHLRFTAMDENFAFSCIPYTASELENATHQEELPIARRTVVSILGSVRGVGGIDSWGSDVEEPWHIDAEKDICYSFEISI